MKENFPIELLEKNSTLPDADTVLERFRQLVIDGPAASPVATASSELTDTEHPFDESEPMAPDAPTPMWDDELEMEPNQDTVDLDSMEAASQTDELDQDDANEASELEDTESEFADDSSTEDSTESDEDVPLEEESALEAQDDTVIESDEDEDVSE